MKKMYYLLSCMGMLLISLFVLAIPCNVKAATVWDSKTLTQNTTVDGDLTINGTLQLKGYKLTINGNVIANADVYTGEYGRIVVSGNYTQKKNYLDCKSGTINVAGDLSICGLDSDGNQVKGSGNIISNEASVINVDKNFFFNSTGSNANGYGTYNVKGDFVDKTGEVWKGTLNLCGNSQQKLDLSDLSSVNVNAENSNIKLGKYFGGTLLSNLSVTTDENIIYSSREISLKGFNLSIPVDMVVEDALYTRGGKLNINGNYTQKNGSIMCDGGSLNVKGDLAICGLDSDGNRVKGSASFDVYSDAVVNIDKDFIFDSTGSNWSGYGTYNVKGDFVDKTGKVWKGTLNLCGTKQQKLELSSGSYVKINAQNQDIKIGKYFGGELLSNLSVKTDEKIVYTSDEISIDKYTLTIPADVIADEVVNITNGGKLIVKGNYTQKKCALGVGNGSDGTMEVSGDLNICGLDGSGNKITGTSNIYDTKGSVIKVQKNFLYDTTSSWGLSGKYNVKGDFIDKAGVKWDTVNLCGDVSSNKKQTVNVSGGKIYTLSLKSCPKFYNISATYDKLVYNHKWDQGTVTKEPTTTEEGIKTYTCTVCGDTYKDTIPKLTGQDRQLIEKFVSRMYTKALNRAAEEGGKTYWSDELEKQNTDGANVAHGFIFSDEFKNNNLSDEEFVNVMYATFFDRTADNDGKSYWLSLLNSGKSRETVFAGFVNSQEFENLCTEAGIEKGLVMEDGTVVNAGIYQFVKRQYTCCLSRDGERGGMDYWATQIATHAISADDVARKFFYSDEFLNKGYNNEQYISVLYTTFMGRTADDAGLQYWEAQMASGMSRQEVLDSFVASTEFQGILSSYGLQ